MRVLDNVIALMFVSFLVGMSIDPLLRRWTNYEWLSSLYLFSNPQTYERLGVLWFRKLLLSTPLRLFNSSIRMNQNRDLTMLRRIREHMASAEVSHWVGFAFMLSLTVVAWLYRGSNVGLGYVFFNLLGNFFPCLLQQYNKRRLRSLIAALEKRDGRLRLDVANSLGRPSTP